MNTLSPLAPFGRRPRAHANIPTPVWQVGFGAPFYKDAAKTTLATADGDLVSPPPTPSRATI